MKKHISTCIWINHPLKTATEFYSGILHDVYLMSESPFITGLNISGTRITLMNGGSAHAPTPAISLFYIVESKDEFDFVFKHLSAGGEILMPVDTYPWSERYAWFNDKFGVSWQLSVDKIEQTGQRLTPFLTFTGPNFGKGHRALDIYKNLFPDFKLDGIASYPVEMGVELENKILHTQFAVNGTKLMLSENNLPHSFSFTEGVSFMLMCDNQDEIDFYWSKLSKNGEEGRCGWLKDEFGVSWQILPSILGSLMKDQQKIEAVSNAFMQMKKLDIAALQMAAVQV